jgi:hypothetical protein
VHTHLFTCNWQASKQDNTTQTNNAPSLVADMAQDGP